MGYVPLRTISALEVYPLSEFESRFRISRDTVHELEDHGLPIVKIGREKFVRGEAILDLLRQLEAEPAQRPRA